MSVSSDASRPVDARVSNRVTAVPTSGGQTIPALAIRNRAGAYILDRTGNYIVSRV